MPSHFHHQKLEFPILLKKPWSFPNLHPDVVNFSIALAAKIISPYTFAKPIAVSSPDPPNSLRTSQPRPFLINSTDSSLPSSLSRQNGRPSLSPYMNMELRSRTIGKVDPPDAEPTTPTSARTSLLDRMPASEGSPTTPSRRTRSSKSSRQNYSIPRKIAAWLVHLYTATGLLVNMYSLLALFSKANFSLFAKLNWLAILIDATDGTFARAVDIKKVIPTYDGALLDNIIDFQTFAVLPALSVIVFELVEGSIAQNAAAASILLASAYQFCQTIAKTPDAFVGFPSYWNIVVFYIYYLEWSTVVSLALIFTCAIISFVPVHFIYPTRTKACHIVNHVGAYVWAMLMLVPTFYPDSKYCKPALYLSFVYVAYYIIFSVILDIRRRKAEA